MVAALVVTAALFAGSLPARAEGVSEQEYQRVTPPMPRAVRVTPGADGAAIVSWEPPPAPPAGRLAYARTLARYRVYSGPLGEERFIGETRERRFVDRSPPHGGAGYAITAVHGEGQESGRPNAARATVP